MSVLVNATNSFNEKSLEEICKLLDDGERVRIYIDCIGHTRTRIEESNYRDRLAERYGYKLVVENNEYYLTHENKFKALRTKYKLTQKEMSKVLQIPLSTWKNWEYEINEPPSYVYDMMCKILENE